MKFYAAMALAGAILVAGCNGEPDVPQPDKTVQQLMAQDVQPTAEVYWGAVQYISDETGNHDIFPQDDAEWDRVRAAAVKLGEHGQLLQQPEYAHDRGEDWIEFSKALVDVAKMAQTAAAAKDTDKVFEVGGTVYNVCSACHSAYPPAEGIPDVTGGGAS